ncbi:peptidase M10 [Winogradskyella sp. PC-19]|uniref:M57 family metalloprotease n=1 Tax=unclassified Winogradskyella TaxID=2615021 RepID=UPI000B3CBBAB|nr:MULTISPECIES: M57 family metalloprotease [unclassified Winogradskyella]ARV09091.1 peptidase M10 [Winogradskyella sp. PC-19]RZN78251.1 MAG: peptidase M10 [Winogradskyella sp.]
MKNLTKNWLILLSALALTFTACEKDGNAEEEVLNIDDSFLNTTNLENRTVITDTALLNSIKSLDIDVGTVSVGNFHLPDGTVEERIYIGNDITFTRDELELLINPESNGRQYRTFNLVEGANRTIDILGYTGGSQALSSKAQTALQWSVNNYNNLNTTLQFNLTFGTNFQAADMVVYDNTVNTPNSQGGVAGFPNSSGEPNKFVQIYNIEQFSTNVNEHVITHEIGHSVGFRHSDWFDRLSCPASSQGNEGTGSDGAVHIPGTPTGRDLTSVMQACFSTSEDGEFNGNDIIALEFMYPEAPTGPCDGVSEWQSGVSYSIGDRVTYFGNLYERVSSGWTLLGPCN